MHKSYVFMLIITVLFAGGYFYYVAKAICPVPLSYTVGQIDPEFELSLSDAKLVLFEAESIWEDASGQNLFTYDEDAGFVINFVYDERQATTDAEGDFKDKLDSTQDAADAINSTYDELVEQYDTLQIQYSNAVEKYERDITAYNTQVEELNEKGGATPEEFALLEERKVELDQEREDLNVLSGQLNGLVTEINRVGDRGNKIIETYNRGVAEYNDTFGESREFTQGTYSSDGRIDIYAYENMDELRLVLAHELGHAISLDHVANEKSIMYFLIGEQPEELVPSGEDMYEFNRVCHEMTVWDTIKLSLDR